MLRIMQLRHFRHFNLVWRMTSIRPIRGDEFQFVGQAREPIFRIVGDVEDLGDVSFGDLLDQFDDEGTIHWIKPLAGFIEDQQMGMFDQGPGDQ